MICRICGKELRKWGTHMSRVHGLELADYFARFPDATIRCACCGREKLPAEFPVATGKSSGRQSWCASCHAEYRQVRYSDPAEKENRRLRETGRHSRRVLAEGQEVLQKKRRTRNARKYGLSLEEYEARLAEPCGICGCESSAMDHDHATGRLRKALCHNCNLSLGLMKDNPERLRAAASYLEEYANRAPIEREAG